MAFVNFNNLVDDDGSNTTGTLFDVAEIRGLLQGTAVLRSDTGTVNDWLAGTIAGDTYIDWNGTADLTITGLAGGGYVGLEVVIRNVGSGVLYFPHGSAGSAPANRLWNSSYFAAPLPVAPGGWVRYRYGPQGFWMVAGHEQGAWIPVPYAASNFTATGATWTVEAGDVAQYRYRLAGRTLTIGFYLQTTSVGGASGTDLNIALPTGFKILASALIAVPIWVQESGVASIQKAVVYGGSPTIIVCQRLSGFWSATTNATTLSGVVPIELAQS